MSQWYPFSYDWAGFYFSTGGNAAVGYGYYSPNYVGHGFPCSTMYSNTWYHLAFVKKDYTTSVYLDGQFQSSVYDTASITSSSKIVVIGANQDQNLFGNKFDGYIQDLRWMIRYAKYTSNFTPPIGPARLK